MKLDDTIAKAIKEYPSLFKDVSWEKSRIKVFDHLFLTIGNGFEWFDGYLAEELRGSKPLKYGRRKFEWRPDETWFGSSVYREAKWSPEIEALIKDNPTFAGLLTIEERSNYIPKPYPICEYSAIVTAPDNIQSDWLAGAIETAEWAKSFYEGPLTQAMSSEFIKTDNLSEKVAKTHIDHQLTTICKALSQLNEKKLKKT